jgi:hypothetical protein
MDKQKKDNITLFILIISFVLGIVPNLLTMNWSDVSIVIYIIVFFYIGAFFFALHRWENTNKICELGRNLFFSRFGVQPDNVEYLNNKPLEYDRLAFGLYGSVFQLKFFLKGKELRGIINREEQGLYMREPVYMPVYTTESIPVWKEIIEMYGTGIPKKIEYYDDTRALIGVDFLYENGMLKKKSWRRHEGILKRWNMENREWIPQ